MNTEFATTVSGITVSLHNAEIWQKFYPETEMIVTIPGRNLFPRPIFNIEGLESDSLYHVFVSLERTEDIKFKFDGKKWKKLGQGDEILPVVLKEHPRGARLGSFWMEKPVNFSHIKITNNSDNTNENAILVQSMHKFRVVVSIKKVGCEENKFGLELTEFIVTTAYQNKKMNELKVAHNPFARRKRNSSKSTDAEPAKRQSISPALSSSTSSTVSSPPPIHQANPPTPVVYNHYIYPANNFPVPPSFPTYYNQFNTIPTGIPNTQMNWNPVYYHDMVGNNQFHSRLEHWNTGYPMNFGNGFNSFNGR